MSELQRLAKEGNEQRRMNIEMARQAWAALRRERTDEGAILYLLSLIEHEQHYFWRAESGGGDVSRWRYVPAMIRASLKRKPIGRSKKAPPIQRGSK